MGGSWTRPDVHWLSGRQMAVMKTVFNFASVELCFHSIDNFTLHSQVFIFHRTQQTAEMFIQVRQWMNVENTLCLMSECFMHLTVPAQPLHVLKVLSPVRPVWVVGAVPPWLQDDPLEGSSGASAHPQIGPSLQDFLKQSKTSCTYLVYTHKKNVWLILA